MALHRVRITLVSLTIFLALIGQAFAGPIGFGAGRPPQPHRHERDMSAEIARLEREWAEREANFPTPKIVTGDGLLEMETLLSPWPFGPISDIQFVEFDATPGLDLVVVGNRGALVTDLSSGAESRIWFQFRRAHIDLIDIEGDGSFEFMNRGGGMGAPASVLSSDGSLIWFYGESPPGVNDMAAGDVDGDGELEFAVGFNGGGGIRLLESDGSEIWRRPDGNVWHVEIADTNGDGLSEIVHSNARGQMMIRSASDGNVLNRRDLTSDYFSDFSLTPWPLASSPLHVIHARRIASARVMNFRGQVIANYTIPHLPDMGYSHATPVQFGPDGAHFAVLVTFVRPMRSFLAVFNPDGDLIFEEVIDGEWQSIKAHPWNGEEHDSLFVGGTTELRRYSMTSSAE